MPSSGLMSTSMIEQGWAALNAGDVATARDAFEEALAEAESGSGARGTWSGALPAAGLRRGHRPARAGIRRIPPRRSYIRGREGRARILAWITGQCARRLGGSQRLAGPGAPDPRRSW